MNKKQKQLKIQMTIFSLLVFIFLGTILVTEKTSFLLIPKVETKINNYIDKNYKDIKNNINKSQISYKATKFTMKITDKSNKYHYFYIYYKDKKITDTYKKDYVKGKSLINHTTSLIQKDINKNLSNKYKVSINYNLNDFSINTQENIINENNLSNLRIYNIEKNIKLNDINTKNIADSIYNEITTIESKTITPRTYSFKFIDENNRNNVLKISNITYKFINNTNNINIINDIIDGKNSSLVRKSNIKFEYID